MARNAGNICSASAPNYHWTISTMQNLYVTFPLGKSQSANLVHRCLQMDVALDGSGPTGQGQGYQQGEPPTGGAAGPYRRGRCSSETIPHRQRSWLSSTPTALKMELCLTGDNAKSYEACSLLEVSGNMANEMGPYWPLSLTDRSRLHSTWDFPIYIWFTAHPQNIAIQSIIF